VSGALPWTPYHIAEQNFPALLEPVAAELARLTGRLETYHRRLHMAAVDRSRVDRAREVVARAQRELAALASER